MISLAPLKPFATLEFAARMSCVAQGLANDHAHTSVVADRVEARIKTLTPYQAYGSVTQQLLLTVGEHLGELDGKGLKELETCKRHQTALAGAKERIVSIIDGQNNLSSLIATARDAGQTASFEAISKAMRFLGECEDDVITATSVKAALCEVGEHALSVFCENPLSFANRADHALDAPSVAQSALYLAKEMSAEHANTVAAAYLNALVQHSDCKRIATRSDVQSDVNHFAVAYCRDSALIERFGLAIR